MAMSYEDEAKRDWARLCQHQQGLGGLLVSDGIGTGMAQQSAMNQQSAYLRQYVDQSKIAERAEGIEKEKAEAQRVALLLLL